MLLVQSGDYMAYKERGQALPQKARENPRVNKEDWHLRPLCPLIH